MRFTLIYDGRLPSTGNNAKNPASKKWQVRAQFDPQLRKLWDESPDLHHLRGNSIVAKDGQYILTLPHPLYPEAKRRRLMADSQPVQDHEIDLCEPIQKGARKFFPIVRRSLGLTCQLKILFLRHEPRGRLLQSGDLDNRIKTLIDALGIPRDESSYEDVSLADPVYCLYEDDSLVTAMDVRTEHLLAPAGELKEEKQVRLVIEVDVRVSRPRAFNVLFSGD